MVGQRPLSRQLIEEEIDEAQRLRGWFVNSYAQIEYLLGSFIVTSIGMAEYASLGTDLPHRPKGRIERVRSIATIDGPLRNYADFMLYIVNRFEGWEETRNLLAHGFCEFVFTAEGDRGMRFQKWHREKGKWKPDLKMTRDFRIDDLQKSVREITDISRQAVLNLNGIQQQFGISFDR